MAKEVGFKWNKSLPSVINDLGINYSFNLAVAESSARYMNPYVPMKDGTLSQTYETGADIIGGYVKYIQLYSHYQYDGVGFDFSKEKHQLATHHWDKAMMLSKGEQFTREVDRLRKRFSK